MTKTHEIKLDGYGAHTTLAEDRPIMLLGTAESYGIETLHVVSGKSWEGLTVTATFNAPDGTSTDMLMSADGSITVPSEATAKSGSGRIVFAGVSNGIQRISCDLEYFVVAHSAINGVQSGGTAPSWFEQAVTRFMPTGGTAGQVLTKLTDTDFEAEWQDSKGGADGITPTIGDNGNWYLGATDTGKPSRGEKGDTGEKGEKGDTGASGPQGPKGATGATGADGKSAYSYAQDGGYTGTEAEFAAKLAAEKLPNPYPLTFTGAVNETYDGSSAKTIEIPSGGGSGAHSDWNQNDSTAADYIKNRPFYTGDPVETILVEENTVSFVEEGGLYGAQFQSTFVPTVGETYKVSWDGTVYECTCVDFSGVTVIGNLSIAGAGSDTGEPFLMRVNGDGKATIYTLDTSASHTISISAFVQEVVKIDLKYLPMSTDDSYGVIKKSDIVSSYNFPMRAPHDRMLDAINAFNTGNASIVWDGEKVIMARYDSSNDTISVVFANEPLKLLTYSNLDGFYNGTLGSGTYGELQGNQMRIVNDEGAYTVLSTEGTPSDTTLSVGAERISFDSVYGLSKHELILRSSTENSTKTFKITVDDSGTISATEVV